MITGPQQRKCKRKECRNWFQVYPSQRGRPKEFCSDRCRQIHFTGALEEDVRKAQQAARKYLSSLREKKCKSRLGQRQIITKEIEFYLGLLLKKWPQGKSKTAQYETAWQELGEIQRLLWCEPPDPNATIARMRAIALQEMLAPLASKDRTAARTWIYCEEIKRDAGVPGVSEEALTQVETQVQIVEQLWYHEQHDYLNFVHALLTHAVLDCVRRDRAPNAFVAEKYTDQARRRLHAALHILKGPCYKQDKVLINMLRHQVTLRLFRLEAFQYKYESGAEKSLAQIEQFQEQINERIDSPLTSIETLREKAGYYQEMKKELDEANTLLNEANALFQQPSDKPIIAQLSLLRPKLEILRQQRDYSSLEKESNKYLALLHKHPNAHNVNQLRNLVRAMYKDSEKEKVIIDEIDRDISTLYTQPIMIYLYYEDFSLRREGIL